MTLIAALIDRKKTVHMMSDRMYSFGDNVLIRAVPKIHFWNPSNSEEKVLVGTAGSQELDMACSGLFTPPALPHDKSKRAFYKWAMSDACPNLWENLSQRGLLEKDKDAADLIIPGHVLIAGRGTIVRIAGKAAPIMIQDPYWAIGSGVDYALGIMRFALKKSLYPTKADCKSLLLDVMRATTYHLSNVRAPFDYINTEGEEDTFDD